MACAARGAELGASALYGSPAKGAGVLNNEFYVGRYVWNRSKWIKNPDTGSHPGSAADVARSRDALRAMLGDVRLIEDNGTVYAECDNAAERLLLAVGGVSMGRIAGHAS